MSGTSTPSSASAGPDGPLDSSTFDCRELADTLALCADVFVVVRAHVSPLPAGQTCATVPRRGKGGRTNAMWDHDIRTCTA
jgi:hypothetical protein